MSLWAAVLSFIGGVIIGRTDYSLKWKMFGAALMMIGSFIAGAEWGKGLAP